MSVPASACADQAAYVGTRDVEADGQISNGLRVCGDDTSGLDGGAGLERTAVIAAGPCVSPRIHHVRRQQHDVAGRLALNAFDDGGEAADVIGQAVGSVPRVVEAQSNEREVGLMANDVPIDE